MRNIKFLDPKQIPESKTVIRNDYKKNVSFSQQFIGYNTNAFWKFVKVKSYDKNLAAKLTYMY